MLSILSYTDILVCFCPSHSVYLQLSSPLLLPDPSFASHQRHFSTSADPIFSSAPLLLLRLLSPPPRHPLSPLRLPPGPRLSAPFPISAFSITLHSVHLRCLRFLFLSTPAFIFSSSSPRPLLCCLSFHLPLCLIVLICLHFPHLTPFHLVL